jgi:hypothetical protein
VPVQFQPEQVEIDDPEMLNFWQDLSHESGLEIDYLQRHLFKRNDKGELSKKLGVIPAGEGALTTGNE